jgi:hypothetical protein
MLMMRLPEGSGSPFTAASAAWTWEQAPRINSGSENNQNKNCKFIRVDKDIN